MGWLGTLPLFPPSPVRTLEVGWATLVLGTALGGLGGGRRGPPSLVLGRGNGGVASFETPGDTTFDFDGCLVSLGEGEGTEEEELL